MPLNASGNSVLPDSGETIENSRGPVTREFSINSFEEFLRDLKEHREHGNQILDSVSKDRGKAQFENIAQNVWERKTRLDMAVHHLDNKICDLEINIKGQTQLSFDNELEKQDLESLKAFRLLVEKETEREEIYKTKAMEKFLSLCVHHNLDAGDSA
ncbi:unnamed protein product [Lymnaea stagnalis]|uniref:Uncharacterized protein n=1 Tax=Lymnaea stagnalis TaxID=6523 RepID=A0AAV2IF28_LYMST